MKDIIDMEKQVGDDLHNCKNSDDKETTQDDSIKETEENGKEMNGAKDKIKEIESADKENKNIETNNIKSEDNEDPPKKIISGHRCLKPTLSTEIKDEKPRVVKNEVFISSLQLVLKNHNNVLQKEKSAEPEETEEPSRPKSTNSEVGEVENYNSSVDSSVSTSRETLDKSESSTDQLQQINSNDQSIHPETSAVDISGYVMVKKKVRYYLLFIYY